MFGTVVPNVLADKVLIGFATQPGRAEEALVRGTGGTIKHTYHIVPAIAADVPGAVIAQLRANRQITHVHPDGRVQALDTELDGSWGVKRIGAGTVHSYNRGTGVKVAILDTGIDYTHIDLDANYVRGYDFVNSDIDPMDDHGHGTHVAGIVAAEDNGTGVVGVAPEAKLYALKVLDASGSGYWSDIIAALQWAVDNNMQMVNMSLGADRAPDDVKNACDNAYAAGVLLFAAAGNDGNPRGKGNSVDCPARYDSVIAVAATDQSDQRASWSSTGDQVELAVPGVDINSTLLGGGYGEKSGTSMSSPHVAGTAALVWTAFPDWTNAGVRNQLQVTAVDLGKEGKDSLYGYGLVDADEAAPSTEPNNPPVANAGEPYSGTEDVAITFDGSGSSDPDNDSLTYTWDFGDGATGTGVNPSHAYAYGGTFTVTLTVSDGKGGTNSDVTNATVTEVNDKPVADTNEPYSGTIGTAITFDGSGSYDPDNQDGTTANDQTLTYSWDFGDGATGTGVSPSHAYVAEGIYTVTLVVNDGVVDSELSDTTATVTTEPTEPTTVSISSITYSTTGGKHNNLHLLSTINLVDNLGNPVASASVSIDVSCDDSLYASETDTTGTSGTVTFKFTKAPSGYYTTTVTYVSTAQGLTWGGVTPENGFNKDGGSSKGRQTALLQNTPNPFNPETWIPFKLSKTEHVVIKIYNVTGNLVRTLDLGDRPTGAYISKDKAGYWDGRSITGEKVASGVYFYLMEAGKFRAMRKMVIMK